MKTISFAEWSADMVKEMYPHAKTVKVVDHYWGAGDMTDVNLEFSRKKDGYSNAHYTPKYLEGYYKVKDGRFDNEFNFVCENS